MDKKSVHLIIRASEHLFQLAQQLSGLEDEVRSCDWLLQAIWRQLVAISGPSAARPLFAQAILEASTMWPLAKLVKVTNTGIDVTDLRQAYEPPDCGLVGEACKTVMQNCFGLVVTLAGESLVKTIVDRVEAELRGLGGSSADFEQTESDQESHSAA